ETAIAGKGLRPCASGSVRIKRLNSTHPARRTPNINIKTPVTFFTRDLLLTRALQQGDQVRTFLRFAMEKAVSALHHFQTIYLFCSDTCAWRHTDMRLCLPVHPRSLPGWLQPVHRIGVRPCCQDHR